MTKTTAEKKEYMREFRKRPEAIARAAAREGTTARKAYKKKTIAKWRKTPSAIALRRAYYASAKGAFSVSFTSAKRRARKDGRDFTITMADVDWREICPITGEKMIPNTPFAPTLDRKDNSKGYVPGNVFVICKYINSRKGNLTAEHIKNLHLYMEGKLS